MDSKGTLEHLLSNKYEPEDQSPQRFLQSYRVLEAHRDDLQKKCEAKEKKRADIKASRASGPAPEVSGSRFSSLLNSEEDPTLPPPTKHKFAGRLTDDRLNKLSKDERKAQVTRIKNDIQVLQKEKKEKRAAGGVEAKDERAEDEVTKESDRDG